MIFEKYRLRLFPEEKKNRFRFIKHYRFHIDYSFVFSKLSRVRFVFLNIRQVIYMKLSIKHTSLTCTLHSITAKLTIVLTLRSKRSKLNLRKEYVCQFPRNFLAVFSCIIMFGESSQT